MMASYVNFDNESDPVKKSDQDKDGRLRHVVFRSADGADERKLNFLVCMLRLIMVLLCTSVILSCAYFVCLLSARVYLSFSAQVPVILISMDGFRHDYIEVVKEKRGQSALPNFDKLLQTGVRVLKCTNGYPTITAPNHQSIVTGLYPESHGIIANNILDRNYPNDTYNLDSQVSLDFAHWLPNTQSAMPIWAELEQSGFKVGSMLWPFVDQAYAGILPTKMQSEYGTLNMGDHNVYSMNYGKRVDRVLRWLADSDESVDFVMMYFEEPDAIGHAYGPDSEELADMVVQLDGYLGQLLDGLSQLNIKANIILTADHGMTQLSDDKMIHVEKCLEPGTYSYTWMSTSGFLYANESESEDVYQRLKMCHPQMKVYKINEVPGVEHFNHPPDSRAPDFVLIAEPGWVMVDKNQTHVPIAGNHGYSVTDSEMNPILIFSGPSFFQNKTMPAMSTMDIYPAIAYLYNILAHPNNGTMPHDLMQSSRFII